MNPPLNAQDTFTSIYEEREWGHAHDVPWSSGLGSSVAANLHWITFLREFISQNDVDTVVDLGCGDWRWAAVALDGLPIDYTGYDVFPKLIDHLRQTYGSSKRTFEHADITHTSNLKPACLGIMKDVAQHWPNKTLQAFLSSIRATKLFDNLLLVNDIQETSCNADTKLGAYRPLPIYHNVIRHHGCVAIKQLPSIPHEKSVFLFQP